jgi:hypothetical protein
VRGAKGKETSAPLVGKRAAGVAGFLGGHADKLTDAGHRRLVRHGHLPEREIMTGIGPVRDQLG